MHCVLKILQPLSNWKLDLMFEGTQMWKSGKLTIVPIKLRPVNFNISKESPFLWWWNFLGVQAKKGWRCFHSSSPHLPSSYSQYINSASNMLQESHILILASMYPRLQATLSLVSNTEKTGSGLGMRLLKWTWKNYSEIDLSIFYMSIGQHKVSWLKEESSFQGEFCSPFWRKVAGINHSYPHFRSVLVDVLHCITVWQQVWGKNLTRKSVPQWSTSWTPWDSQWVSLSYQRRCTEPDLALH